MTPEERARALRVEAGEVLGLVHLHEVCSGVGEIVPTGSYFLDVMMYPDIDVYLPPTSAKALMEVGTRLASLDCVKRMNFEKGGPGDLADGLYLKPVVEHGHWERPWKIDIWSLPLPVIANKQEELVELRRKMTVGHRQRILAYKWSVMTDTGRTPMLSGIHIYRAVIDKGLTDSESITSYLRENGIDI